MTTHIKHLSEPWFSYVCSGKKTVEGRYKKEFAVGDTILFWNMDTGIKRECKVTIVAITEHKSFLDMLRFYGLEIVLPGISTLKEGLAVYEKYYDVNSSALAICITPLT